MSVPIQTWGPPSAGTPGGKPSHRLRTLVLALLVIIVLLGAALVYVLATRDDAPPPNAAGRPVSLPTAATSSPYVTQTGEPSGEGIPLGFTDVRTVTVFGTEVRTSPTLGPRDVTDDGNATGFAHTLPGAVIAAVNIMARISYLAPAQVNQEALTSGTVGSSDQRDVLLRQAAESRQEIATTGGTYSLASTRYRIDKQDYLDPPMEVTLTLLQELSVNGQVRMFEGPLQLRWSDGDWRIVLPLADAPGVTSPSAGMATFPSN